MKNSATSVSSAEMASLKGVVVSMAADGTINTIVRVPPGDSSRREVSRENDGKKSPPSSADMALLKRVEERVVCKLADGTIDTNVRAPPVGSRGSARLRENGGKRGREWEWDGELFGGGRC